MEEGREIRRKDPDFVTVETFNPSEEVFTGIIKYESRGM